MRFGIKETAPEISVPKLYGDILPGKRKKLCQNIVKGDDP